MCNIRWYHIAAGIIAVIIVMAFIYAVRSVLPPFVIAFVVAWLLDPLIDNLESRKWPRIAAVLLVFAIFLAIFAVGLVFLVPAVIDQARQLALNFPRYLSQFHDYGAELLKTYKPTLLRFELPVTFQDVLSTYGDNLNLWLTSAISAITGWISSNLSKALWVVLVPLVSFYCLNEIDRMRAKASLLIPERWRLRTTHVLARVGTVFTGYVRGLLIVCLMYGVSTATALSILGIKYGLLIGLFAAILYAVPYIGAISTTLLVFLVALATHGPDSHYAIWVPPVAVLIMNQVFDLFITPRILGKSVGLHPVLSLFALLAGGQLFGLAGMILAVPIAASVQEIVFEIYPLLRKTSEELMAMKEVPTEAAIEAPTDDEKPESDKGPKNPA